MNATRQPQAAQGTACSLDQRPGTPMMTTATSPYELKPNTLAYALAEERKAKIEASDWHANGHLAPLFPGSIVPTLHRRYLFDHRVHGRAVADQKLRRHAELLEHFPHTLVDSDDAVRDLAKSRAQTCHRIRMRCPNFDRAYIAIADFVRRFSIEPPTPGEQTTVDGAVCKEITVDGAVRRLCDEKWWRRQIRKTYGRRFEEVARDIGRVHKRAGIYASDETVKRRQQQKASTRLLLEALIAVNQLGEEYTLAELQALSVSNPKHRRAELMVRLAGFEAEAKRLGYVAEFYTLTCHSCMHPRLAASGSPNPYYDGTSAREAHEYLQGQWRKIRAALARRGIRVYGFRIAEAHHDGTPHWHLLLFMRPEEVGKVREILRHYALQVDGDEPGAQEHRFKAEAIDWSRGTATGYVAKYVSKNIDGHAVDCDQYGRDARDSAVRIDAWASVWGIRQFQQIGGPPVTVWRELRRLRLSTAPAGVIDDAFACAHVGDWAGFCRVMGGPRARRSDAPIQLLKAHSDKPNRYEEATGDVIVGVMSGDVTCTTRFYDWEIRSLSQKNASGHRTDALERVPQRVQQADGREVAHPCNALRRAAARRYNALECVGEPESPEPTSPSSALQLAPLRVRESEETEAGRAINAPQRVRPTITAALEFCQ
jgi:hypothetical protein